MKIKLLCLFLFGSTQLFLKAQTYHYFPMDSIDTDWYGGCVAYNSHQGAHNVNFHAQMHGDTLLYGWDWKKISDPVYAYIREDSSKKVFMQYPWDPDSTGGHLTFDFGARIGDTVPLFKWTFFFTPQLRPVIVTSIDTVLVGSSLRKRFSVISISNPSYEQFWIEGIGSTHYGLFMIDLCGENTSICYVTNSSGVVYNLPCFLTAINSIAEIPFSVNTFPNPVSDILHLEIEGSSSKYYMSIVDVTGKEIRSLTSEKPSLDLDVSDLAAGIYVFRIEEKAGNLVTKKIVKQ